ncbi:hypothetical protein SAMN05720354_11654 [Nitrosospira sp. Nsp1]|nr:hypothetical protein SAMN05720354_11654 [Nitrosospira sp. Nsp1]
MMWSALSKASASATAALREGMRERRRHEWCNRSRRGGAFLGKARRQSGISAPQARPRHSWRCRIAASRDLSGNASGYLTSTKRVTCKAAIPSLHWKMNGKTGHACRCPSWHTRQTMAFAVHLVITPIFAAVRSPGNLFEGSQGNANMTC